MFKRQIRSALPALLRVVSCLLFFFSAHPRLDAARADSIEDATRNLARKAAAAVHGSVVNLDPRNLSSLKAAEFSHLRAVFQEELLRHGVKVSTNSGAVKIVLTVTGHLTGYVGVAEIRRLDGTTTEIESLGRMADSSPGNPQAGITLRKEFLFAQERPIEDVVFSVDRKHAYALGLQEVYSYERTGEQWTPVETERLPIRAALNREVRGFLETGTDTWTAYFLGELCRKSKADGNAWRCESYREPMPIRSVPEEMLAAKKSPPWFSAARFEEDGHPRLMLAGRDGIARLYEDGSEPVSTYSEWGSEIASIQSGCGKGWQILITGKGDWAAADSMQAVEIQDRATQAVSQSVDFGGPVVALHNPSPKNSTGASDASDAVAIVHDLESGRYEAYRLTITCGN